MSHVSPLTDTTVSGPLSGEDGRHGVPARSFSFLHYAERQKLDRFLFSGGEFCLMFFEVENFTVFRDLYGGLISGRVMEIMEEELEALMSEHLGHCSLAYMDCLGAGGWVVLCGLGRGDAEKYPEAALGDVLLAFRLRLKSRIRQEALNMTGRNLDVLAGFAKLDRLTGRPMEQAVYDALYDAQRMAKGMLDSAHASLMTDFRALLSQGRLTSVFQPIVKLTSGEIMAWEALTRGPQGSHFRSPAVLFDFAEEVDQVFELEKACRQNAVHGIGRLEQDQKLFLNINPLSIVDPDFTPGQTLALLEEHGLRPSDVVLEITERHSIRDFTLFHRTLEHYRTQGFKVAIDDVGTGYSGLWSIAEIRPDFLKVDMSLVQGIDANPVKRALLETFVTFSEHIGCRLIAEGIEQENELDILMRMGVHLGQGFLLARPAAPKPGLSGEVRGFFTAGRRNNATGDRKCSTPVRALVEEALTVPPSATVREVRALLGEAGPSGSAVVAEKGRPLGLVMGHHLDHALSSRFGNSLYSQRSVTLVMDPSPLYAEAGTAVENVAQEAMARKKSKIFDHIVVTKQGKLAGIVTVQRILDTMASVQVEMAKGANPLTGLPGNVAIELEMERRCATGEPFSVIYADLDNFKVFNDTYGFKNGDNIILLIGRIMSWAVRRHGDAEHDFTGHIGGDDLVVVCGQDRAERISLAVTRCFGRLVRSCYLPRDRSRGWIESADRSGEMRRFPLVSVSLAVVDCVGACDMRSLGQRAAEMKKYAKSLEGNSWVRDRRGPVGLESDDGEDACEA